MIEERIGMIVVPPPPAATILVNNNYSYCDGFFVAYLSHFYTDEIFLCNSTPPIINTNDINLFYINEYDDNGSQFIPSLDFLNNNTLLFTFTFGTVSINTISPPNNFSYDYLNLRYISTTSSFLTFNPPNTNFNMSIEPYTIKIQVL